MIPIIHRFLFGNQVDNRHPAQPDVVNLVPPVQVINNGVPNQRRRVGNNVYNRNRGVQRAPVVPAVPGQRVELMAPVGQVAQNLQPDEPVGVLETVHPRFDREFLESVFAGTPRVTVLGSVEMDIF